MRGIKGECPGKMAIANKKNMAVKTAVRPILNNICSLSYSYLSYFRHKTVPMQPFYTKVNTVTRANTCDRWFKGAIADTKKERRISGALSQVIMPRCPEASFQSPGRKGPCFRRLQPGSYKETSWRNCGP